LSGRDGQQMPRRGGERGAGSSEGFEGPRDQVNGFKSPKSTKPTKPTNPTNSINSRNSDGRGERSVEQRAWSAESLAFSVQLSQSQLDKSNRLGSCFHVDYLVEKWQDSLSKCNINQIDPTTGTWKTPS
jgi:hypothetical protein